MAKKKPIFVGNHTVKDGVGTKTTPIIINTSEDLWVAIGSPAFDNTLLQGTTQNNRNGDFQYPKSGTFSGKTITLFSTTLNANGNPKTYQIQYPPSAPTYLLDRFLNALTGTPELIDKYKVRGGRETVVGTTIVSAGP